jgi:predicted P-loop ATPase
VFEPGCKFDYMLILEGAQGIGKSTVTKILATKKYHASIGLDLATKSSEKDTIAALAGKQIVEVEEMVIDKRSDVEQLKAFITREEDIIRMPYGRITKPYPRQCIFIGTINPESGVGYLKDPTGARRFWPVTCREINIMGLILERDQLFAEAFVRYGRKEKLYLSPEATTLAFYEQAERLVQDPWMPLIEKCPRNRVWTTLEIFRDIMHCDPRYMGVREQKRISALMRDEGFVYGLYTVADKRVRGFRHPECPDHQKIDAILLDKDVE